MRIILLICLLLTIAGVFAAPKQCQEMNRIICNINKSCAWNFEKTLCFDRPTNTNFSQSTTQSLTLRNLQDDPYGQDGEETEMP